MSSQTPQITQLIVNDIANSQLSSYQIAYKYHISKTSVDHIGRSHLGDSLYDQKEQLACQKLNEDIQTLKDQGLSSNKIGEKLGVYKSTIFALIKRLSSAPVISEQSDEVQVISVENPELNLEPPVAEEPQSLPKTEVPVRSMPSPYGRIHNHSYNRNHHHQDFVKLQLKGIQITFDPKQENISDTISKILTALHS